MRPTLPPKAPVVVIESRTHTAAPIASPEKWRRIFSNGETLAQVSGDSPIQKFPSRDFDGHFVMPGQDEMQILFLL